MNAYELAEQVEMWGEDLLALNMKGGIPVIEGAKLIRQQADRIAELEKQTFFIADPKKQGEPVAWMLADKQNECIRSIMAVQHDFVPEGCVEIPLYTTPQTKPLSDEEIQALWTVKHPNVMSLNPDLLEFARAIEERHGIK